MSRNKSLLLVIAFCLLAVFSGSFFWQQFGRSDDDTFDKLKEEAKANLAKSEAAAAAATKTEAGQIPPVPSAPPSPAVAGQATNNSPSGMEPGAETAAPTPASDPAIDTTSEKSPITDKKENDTDKADWKTFEGDGFQFQYPPEAVVSNSGGLIRVTQNGATWKMRKFSDDDKTSLQTWYEAEFSVDERQNCTMAEQSTLKVGTYETKYVSPGTSDLECGKAGYFTVSSDSRYVLRIELGEAAADDANKILGTLKFGE